MRASKIAMIMLPLALVAMGIAVWANFSAPLEETEGIVQKTLYVHVPSIFNAYLAFFVGLIASIGVLVTRKRSWDRVAVASTEIGVVFATIMISTGPVWAKAIWGVWWQWDARLTSALVLWFMYVGYFVARSLAPDRETGAKWSAVISIVAFLDIPIVHWSVQWWRTLHPLPKVLDPNGLNRGLAPEMVPAFWLGVVGFLFLYLLLLFFRLGLERLEDDAEARAQGATT